MMSKKDNKIIIMLSLLGFLSFIGGGFARFLSHYVILTSWIDGVVGLGMAGALCSWGVLGIVWSQFAPGIIRKILSALLGVIGVFLGLFVISRAIMQLGS